MENSLRSRSEDLRSVTKCYVKNSSRFPFYIILWRGWKRSANGCHARCFFFLPKWSRSSFEQTSWSVRRCWYSWLSWIQRQQNVRLFSPHLMLLFSSTNYHMTHEKRLVLPPVSINYRSPLPAHTFWFNLRRGLSFFFNANYKKSLER